MWLKDTSGFCRYSAWRILDAAVVGHMTARSVKERLWRRGEAPSLKNGEYQHRNPETLFSEAESLPKVGALKAKTVKALLWCNITRISQIQRSWYLEVHCRYSLWASIVNTQKYLTTFDNNAVIHILFIHFVLQLHVLQSTTLHISTKHIYRNGNVCDTFYAHFNNKPHNTDKSNHVKNHIRLSFFFLLFLSSNNFIFCF